MSQDSVFGLLLFILSTSEFYIVGNHIMSYAEDTTVDDSTMLLLWRFTLCGAELEEVNSLCILGLALDSRLTFETHLK